MTIKRIKKMQWIQPCRNKDTKRQHYNINVCSRTVVNIFKLRMKQAVAELGQDQKKIDLLGKLMLSYSFEVVFH